MMINILSLKCSLAFAPYLAVSVAEFLSAGTTMSRVVRQGGRGLIVRSDGELLLRHEHRQASLRSDEARHFAATIKMRCECYRVSRLQDEVVLANTGNELLLSHPQSEMWLAREAVAVLGKTFNRGIGTSVESTAPGLPEWLRVSTGGGRLLLSDQRTARWVLLGEDHMRELELRLASLRKQDGVVAAQSPPTIPLKGLTVHLQSALKLAETLGELSDTGRFTPFEEITPTYSLRASVATEGLELSDSSVRVSLTAREARKWANIIRAALVRFNVVHIERGGIRTVSARNEDGRWILQWGDEVLVPKGEWSRVSSPREVMHCAAGNLVSKRSGEFLVLLNLTTGSCVAMTDSELECLCDSDEDAEGLSHNGSS
jgi:hypothetical protein